MNIKAHRKNIAYSSRRLRRARRLYVRICSKAILEATDDSVMIKMSQKMVDRKLYAHPEGAQIPWRDFRYRILRYLYRQHGSPGGHWFFWLSQHGFNHNFSKIKQEKMAV